jgi:hypothetical protein
MDATISFIVELLSLFEFYVFEFYNLISLVNLKYSLNRKHTHILDKQLLLVLLAWLPSQMRGHRLLPP